MSTFTIWCAASQDDARRIEADNVADALDAAAAMFDCAPSECCAEEIAP